MYGGDTMPKAHDEKVLKDLLVKHGIPLNDAVKRGKFYREYFDWKHLTNLYKEGYSIRDLCKITGLSYDVVRVNLLRFLPSLRAFTVKGRTNYTFYTDLFFPKLSNKGAYLLGWLYADGSATKNKFAITLNVKDVEHLNYLASLFGNKKVKLKNNRCTWEVYSVELMEELNKCFNLHSAKSLENFRIPWDKISEENLPYVLLGLFEGDGSIAKECLSCSILLSSNSWYTLLKHKDFKNLISMQDIRTYKLNDYGLLNICFKGYSYFNFLQYLYLSTLEVKPLQRKLDRYVNQLKRSSNGKTSPYKILAVKLWDSLAEKRKL